MTRHVVDINLAYTIMKGKIYTSTPNANMADHSVGAQDESNESKASWASMFCFDNAFPEKSCFIVDLVP